MGLTYAPSSEPLHISAEIVVLELLDHLCLAAATLLPTAHMRQSTPDSGLGFQLKVLKTCRALPSSLGSAVGSGCGHVPLKGS